MNQTTTSTMGQNFGDVYESRRKNQNTTTCLTPLDRAGSQDKIKEKKASDNSQKQKPSFISAELAFSSEQKRLFDKIGYNKLNSKNHQGQARQRDQVIMQTIGIVGPNSQTSKSRRRNIGDQSTKTVLVQNQPRPLDEGESQQLAEIEGAMLQPQIIQGLSSLALDEEK